MCASFATPHRKAGAPLSVDGISHPAVRTIARLSRHIASKGETWLTKEATAGAQKPVYGRTQTPYIPEPIAQWLPGPHSILNEQVFPAVRFGSNGSW